MLNFEHSLKMYTWYVPTGPPFQISKYATTLVPTIPPNPGYSTGRKYTFLTFAWTCCHRHVRRADGSLLHTEAHKKHAAHAAVWLMQTTTRRRPRTCCTSTHHWCKSFISLIATYSNRATRRWCSRSGNSELQSFCVSHWNVIIVTQRAQYENPPVATRQLCLPRVIRQKINE